MLLTYVKMGTASGGRMLSNSLLSLVILTGICTVCDSCASKLSQCQNILYDAVTLLQSGNYGGYCSVSQSYVNCIVTDLSDCDTTLYNITALLASTKATQEVYCPSGSNPGYEICMSRQTACVAVYNSSMEFLTNSSAYCSVLDDFVLCVVSELSLCHQKFFDIAALTSNLLDSYEMTCLTDNLTSCSSQYVTCQKHLSVTVYSSKVKKWDQYCSHSESYLECHSRLTECDSIYSTALTSILSMEQLKEDQTINCGPNGTSLSSCISRHAKCRELLVINGDIEHTVILYYCRSLDKYTKCLVRDMTACKHGEFQYTQLMSVANANWTKSCFGVNINSGNYIHTGPFPTVVLLVIIFLLSSFVS